MRLLPEPKPEFDIIILNFTSVFNFYSDLRVKQKSMRSRFTAICFQTQPVDAYFRLLRQVHRAKNMREIVTLAPMARPSLQNLRSLVPWEIVSTRKHITDRLRFQSSAFLIGCSTDSCTVRLRKVGSVIQVRWREY